jgi:hypothetical protein
MLIAALAAPALIRTGSVTVPQWRVRFVDLKGEPLRGLEVKQTWRNYSVESADEAAENLATGATDGDGWVTFPERRLTTSLLARIIGPVRSIQQGGMHAAFGPQSALYPSCRLMPVGWVEPVYAGGALPESITLRYTGTPEEAKDVVPGDPCAPLIRQAMGGEPGPKERQR